MTCFSAWSRRSREGAECGGIASAVLAAPERDAARGIRRRGHDLIDCSAHAGHVVRSDFFPALRVQATPHRLRAVLGQRSEPDRHAWVFCALTRLVQGVSESRDERVCDDHRVCGDANVAAAVLDDDLDEFALVVHGSGMHERGRHGRKVPAARDPAHPPCGLLVAR